MFNKTFSFFFHSGELSHCLTGPFDEVISIAIARFTEGVAVEGKYDETYFLHNGVPKLREPCPVFVDGLVLRNVPPNSRITIEEVSYPCVEGGDVTLEFDFEGSYKIEVSCWPYLDGEYQIDYSS